MALGLGLAHIEGNLMLYILPAICDKVVHMYRVPHDKCQKADRVLVEGAWLMKHYFPALLLIIPFCGGHNLTRCAVDYLPPPLDIMNRIGL